MPVGNWNNTICPGLLVTSARHAALRVWSYVDVVRGLKAGKQAFLPLRWWFFLKTIHSKVVEGGVID